MCQVRCVTCGATFATQDQLLEHQHQEYHGFACLLCGAELATRGDLDVHLTGVHGRPPLPADAEDEEGADQSTGRVRQLPA